MYTICHPAMRIRPSQDAIARMAYSIWQSKGSHPTSVIAAGVISLGALPSTSGAPSTTPAVGTCAFNPATGKLYIYATAGWVSVTLS
jgi:hypothetical protein